MTLEVRALELHARTHIWSPKTIARSLDFIEQNDMNTLVLHQVDIIEQLVHPGVLFGADPSSRNVHERYRSAYLELHRLIPVQRARPYKNVEYLNWVIREAGRRGVKVFLNNKELDFRDIVLELNPQLTKAGALCPSEPYWFEFLRSKYDELFTDLPDLAGVITAPGSPESRLSIAGNRCRCEQCLELDAGEWYHQLLLAVHDVTDRHGRTLVVRDFVHGPADHEAIASAMKRLPNNVIRSIKNTPRDYYPTYPNNALIGATGGPEWVEFDTMGQFYGWGIAPSIMLDDLRERLEHARSHGVVGLIARVDWEALESHSSFDTPNLVNLYGVAALAEDPNVTSEHICLKWLNGEGWLPPGKSTAEAAQIAADVYDIFRDTWKAISLALYAHGHVFSDSSSYPVSVDEAFWQGEIKHRLKDWAPNDPRSLEATVEGMRSLLAEKDQAVDLWHSIRSRLAERNPGLTEAAYDELSRRFEVAETYLLGFRHAMRCAITTRALLQDPDSADLRHSLTSALSELREHIAHTESVVHDYDIHPVAMLINSTRLQCLHDDVLAQLPGVDLS